jgi:putative ABC transport system permease protein
MASFRKIASNISEFLLVILLVLLVIVVLVGLYFAPVQFKPMVTIIGIFFLVSALFWIGILALLHRLQFKMGLRNLIRHKSDTVIAILGFMVGTSIICSSMAIGDTMTSMIEDLVYDAYDLTDEYMVITDANGEPLDINGTFATEISDIVWSLEEEDLVDGVSWEYTHQVSAIDMNTMLFEPVVLCKALNPETYDFFGPLRSGGSTLDYDLGPGEAYIGKDLSEKLESDVGSIITVSTGPLNFNFTVKAIVDEEGRAGSLAGGDLYMSFQSIWTLANVTPEEEGPIGNDRDWKGGIYNHLYISNEGGRIDGADLCPDVLDRLEEEFKSVQHPLGPSKDLEISGNKKESVDESIEQMDMFTRMFLVLGTFTIIAGITLIINIFVMLSEERKEEMGISRAVGMKRKDLRLTYLFEGLAYSVVSSLVGVLLGVVSGYAMIWGMQSIFDSFGGGSLDLLGNYTVTPLSLVLSFIAGFTITISTTLFIAGRVAKLNIVSAIRNTPVPIKKPYLVTLSQQICGVYDVKSCSGDESTLSKVLQYVFDKVTLFGMGSIIVGIPFLIAGIALKNFAPTSFGISMILIGVALVVKYFFNERITYTIAGMLVLTFWIVPLPVFEDYSGDLEMFILSGIFMVSSSVLLLIWNTDVILWIVEKVVMFLRASPASIKTAISYPVKKRFRTGVTIFMFALIIFTITGMSMIVHIMSINIEGWEKTLGGGYNVIGVSNVGIDNLEEATLQEEGFIPLDIEVYDKIDWDRTISLSIGILTINMSYTIQGMSFEDEIPYQCAGVEDDFISRNTYGFSSVDWDAVYQGENGDKEDRDVWEALKRDDELVILDGSMGGESIFGPAGGGGFIEVGDEIELITADGKIHNKTVIGFTEQMGISAVFMYNRTAESQFGVTDKKVHLITIKDGFSDQDTANDLKRVLLRYGMYTVIISDIIDEILESQNAFFNLFNAFLSLGLIIGIIGLSIVTLRSVYERRHEIGMMRAIGFRKSSVVGSFMGESAFIAGSGLFMGTVLGIILGWMLWRDSFGETMSEFGIPWLKLLGIVGLAFGVAILSAIPPALKAARVTPAEALRYD